MSAVIIIIIIIYPPKFFYSPRQNNSTFSGPVPNPARLCIFKPWKSQAQEGAFFEQNRPSSRQSAEAVNGLHHR